MMESGQGGGPGYGRATAGASDRLTQPAMTVLVLAAGATGAGLVAADLALRADIGLAAIGQHARLRLLLAGAIGQGGGLGVLKLHGLGQGLLPPLPLDGLDLVRSEEHTSELQSRG